MTPASLHLKQKERASLVSEKIFKNGVFFMHQEAVSETMLYSAKLAHFMKLWGLITLERAQSYFLVDCHMSEPCKRGQFCEI